MELRSIRAGDQQSGPVARGNSPLQIRGGQSFDGKTTNHRPYYASGASGQNPIADLSYSTVPPIYRTDHLTLVAGLTVIIKLSRATSAPLPVSSSPFGPQLHILILYSLVV